MAVGGKGAVLEGQEIRSVEEVQSRLTIDIVYADLAFTESSFVTTQRADGWVYRAFRLRAAAVGRVFAISAAQYFGVEDFRLSLHIRWIGDRKILRER